MTGAVDCRARGRDLSILLRSIRPCRPGSVMALSLMMSAFIFYLLTFSGRSEEQNLTSVSFS